MRGFPGAIQTSPKRAMPALRRLYGINRHFVCPLEDFLFLRTRASLVCSACSPVDLEQRLK